MSLLLLLVNMDAVQHCYPSIDIRAMGFPADWINEKLWRDRFWNDFFRTIEIITFYTRKYGNGAEW